MKKIEKSITMQALESLNIDYDKRWGLHKLNRLFEQKYNKESICIVCKRKVETVGEVCDDCEELYGN